MYLSAQPDSEHRVRAVWVTMDVVEDKARGALSALARVSPARRHSHHELERRSYKRLTASRAALTLPSRRGSEDRKDVKKMFAATWARLGCRVSALKPPAASSRPFFRQTHLSSAAPRTSLATLIRKPGLCAPGRTLSLRAAPRRAFDPRFFSANAAHAPVELPILSPPPVARWLLASSGLVFAVIVVGAVTRLTESGLSITEWKPITGILPPLTEAQWGEEFEKYKATPEYKLYVSF